MALLTSSGPAWSSAVPDRRPEAPAVSIVWDFDAAAGQLNATYPYRWREETLDEELACVEDILGIAAERALRMTFAVTGFAAEEGPAPYHVPGLVCRIAAAGHEIASHSWRHEWLPAITGEQLDRTLQRSRSTLESCLGAPGSVRGFVPPFNRPMTWLARGCLSLGDRPAVPPGPGADMGRLLRRLAAAGYAWCRVSCRPVVGRGTALRPRPPTRWERRQGVTCVPHNVCGFDVRAREMLDLAAPGGGAVILTGHPRALLFGRAESRDNLVELCDVLAERSSRGAVYVAPVADLVATAEEER